MMLSRAIHGAFDDLPADQKLLVCQRRAIEWIAFPLLIGQSLLPVLYAFFPWRWLLLAFVCSLVMWPFVRLQLASFKAVWAGGLIGKPKWFIAFGMAIYFYMHNEFGLAVLSVCTPAGMGVLLMFYVSKKLVLCEQLQETFMNQMGYRRIDEDV